MNEEKEIRIDIQMDSNNDCVRCEEAVREASRDSCGRMCCRVSGSDCPDGDDDDGAAACPSCDCAYRSTDTSDLADGRESAAECPYRFIGCVSPASHHDSITDHLLTDLCHHGELLIHWMVNTSNCNASLSTCNIESELVHAELTKLSNLFLSKIMENNEERMRDERLFFGIQQEIKDLAKKNENLLELLKEIKETNMKEIINLKRRIIDLEKKNNEQREIIDSFGLISQPISGTILKLSTSPELQNGTQSHMTLLNDSKSLATFEWEIKELKVEELNCGDINSEFFYSRNGEYEIYLCLMVNGCTDHFYTHHCVEFHLDGSNDQSRWPLSCAVTLTIVNRSQPKRSVALTNLCRFDQSDWLSNCILFHFSPCEIYQTGIFNQDSVLIKCDVEQLE